MRDMIMFLANSIDRLIPFCAGIYLIIYGRALKKKLLDPSYKPLFAFPPTLVTILGWILAVGSVLMLFGRGVAH